MHSPGYFPRGYLCSEGTGGNVMLRALAQRYGFDPATTPWNEMSPEAQQAFLHGDPEPLHIDYRWRSQARWRGVMTELTHWDQGGRYTTGEVCPRCHGKRLRPDYTTIKIDGFDRTDLHTMPMGELEQVLSAAPAMTDELAEETRATAIRRLDFLRRVGLGYLHLDRRTATLSAGPAGQARIGARQRTPRHDRAARRAVARVAPP